MFITRKRLEEIKSATRWETERNIDRERELSMMRTEIYEMKHRLDVLEGKCNPVEHHINMG